MRHRPTVVKKIRISRDFFVRIRKNPEGYDLGPMFMIDLYEDQDAEDSARKTVNIIRHTLGLLGYETDVEFSESMEVGDCFLRWDSKYKISIVHQCWTENIAVAFKDLLIRVAVLNNWNIYEVKAAPYEISDELVKVAI